MAFQTKIAGWIAANARTLGLQVLELGWVKAWLPGFTAIAVSITINERRYRGHGVDVDADTAVIKAVVEGIERAAKDESGLASTSGMAGHSSLSAARDNAVCELIERDAFFCHYLTKVPFTQLDLKTMTSSTFEVDRVLSVARSVGIDLSIASMVVPQGYHAFIGVAFGEHAQRSFGCIIGLGCSLSKDLAVQKALLECLSNVAAQCDGVLPLSLTLSNFLVNKAASVEDHLRLGLDRSSAQVMRRLIAPVPSYAEPLSLGETVFATVNTPQSCQSAPLYFSLATSPASQPAFFGQGMPSFVNLARLSKFVGRPLTIHSLEQHPHMMG